MHARTSEPPSLTFASFMTAQLGILAIVAGGGWMLYQSAIAHVDRSLDLMTERFEARFETLETKIDANGDRIDRNAALIEHNGDLIRDNGEYIAQLRERMAAVEVRVGALDAVVRFSHPPEEDQQTEP